MQVVNQVYGIIGASFGLLFSAWLLLELGDMQFTSTGSGYDLYIFAPVEFYNIFPLFLLSLYFHYS